MQLDEAQGLASRLRDELGRAIIGQQAVVHEILMTTPAPRWSRR